MVILWVISSKRESEESSIADLYICDNEWMGECRFDFVAVWKQ